MSFFSRWAERLIGTLETRNPEAVYESALQEQKVAIARNKDALSSCIVRRNELADQLEAVERELKQVMADLPAAVDTGDDETALVLIQRQDELVAHLQTRTTQLEQARNDVATAKANLQQAKESLDALTREKTRALTELRVAQAELDIQNADSPFSDDPTARGLASVRESVQRMESQAHKGYLDSDGNSIRGKVEAYQERSAEESARAELRRLKAALGAPEPDADADTDEAADGPKKRTL